MGAVLDKQSGSNRSRLQGLQVRAKVSQKHRGAWRWGGRKADRCALNSALERHNAIPLALRQSQVSHIVPRRVVAVIQARMGSSRLPGKVLMRIRGLTALELQVRRLRGSRFVDALCIATSNLPADEAIVDEATRLNVHCYRGSETNVLSRVTSAAEAESADIVVRLTADCPLTDWRIVDAVIRQLRASSADYASNVSPRSFPVGLDCEVMLLDTLRCAVRATEEAYDLEHVTPQIQRDPTIDRRNLTLPVDLSTLRWTLDTPDDLQRLRTIASLLKGSDWAETSWTSILAAVLQTQLEIDHPPGFERHIMSDTPR